MKIYDLSPFLARDRWARHLLMASLFQMERSDPNNPLLSEIRMFLDDEVTPTPEPERTSNRRNLPPPCDDRYFPEDYD